MKKIFAVFVSLFIFSFVFAQNSTKPIKVTEYKLRNGLTVMLTENHNEPQIFGMVSVKAGAKNDPHDATGIAHYLEHMLFKGTQIMGTVDYSKEKPFLDEINDLYDKLGMTKDDEKRKEIQKQINAASKKAGEFAIPNDMDKLLKQIGGSKINAFTTTDMTVYLNAFPSNQIERWLDLYAHRFENPVFRLFQSELETVYEEKNRAMDSPFRPVIEELLKGIYKKHPYGQQSVLGSIEHLKNPSLKKMYEFYNTYYVANNMVLALSGDFNTETVMPMIEEKFGNWRQGKIPEFPEFKEEDFAGREFLSKRMTPISAGFLSFRTPRNGHPDEIKLEVAIQILSNNEGTGFLDKMADEDKLMMAGAIAIPFNDYGSTSIFFVPKILRQKLKSAENLILKQLNKLKRGEFSDEFFEAVKLNKQKEIDLIWENNRDRALEMVQAFSQNRKWEDYYKRYEIVKDITKDDIIEVANKYFGENYFCFYTKMGFPKKEKLDKPGFEPVIPKNEVKSEYQKHFETIKTIEQIPQFVDFEKDITTKKINPHFTINRVKNPFNDIFDLDIKYGIGKYKMPILQYSDDYLSMIGTNDKNVSELKKAYHKLGASFDFTARDESFTMHITGVEKNIEAILKLTNDFMTNVKYDDKKVKRLRRDIKMGNKIERKDPSYISSSLLNFIQLGKNAPAHREFTKKQLKKLSGKELVNAYKDVMKYETTINYVGNEDMDFITELCEKYLLVNKDLHPKEDVVIFDRFSPSKTKIYVLNNKKSVQSKIYFALEGSPRDNKRLPELNAFASYFGGDMSSLVFQEIREFRSLAYSAGGYYRLAKKEGKNNQFFCYLGCQADKTNEAIEAMMNLINDMPEKPERMETIRSSIVEKSKSSKPNFRKLINKVEKWKQEGFTSDPNRIFLKQYEKLNFDDIVNFYKAEIQNKPLIITIVGDVKRFDLEKLKKYGEIIEVKKSELFVN